MRLLLSWVRDFVDVAAPAEEIAGKLGLRGFEVASIEPAESDDTVIDLEVTANRPDCLSVIGLAREIATIYDLPLRRTALESGGDSGPSGENDRLEVSLEDPELCPRYAAAVADVRPVASPPWLTSRLQAAGIRPISAIVDVTNYVLLELGHPMHAFDLEKVEGRTLRIRRAQSGETLTTLDGVERKLDADMLVIADAVRPQAVAGVMGGGLSEVSATTRTVALESAYFSPPSVRRTSKRLGLKTEASSRFERGVDVNAPVKALRRAIGLIQEIGAGRLSGLITDRYPKPRGPVSLHLRSGRLALILGLAVSDSEVQRILRSLGLAVTATPDGWDVLVPTFRVDLAREVDLIEEVGRHYGYDKINATFPELTAPPAPSDPRIAADQLVRNLLTAWGFSEAVTFGFIESSVAAAFSSPRGVPVELANPLSANFGALRPSLIPGLVDAVAHNRRHGRRDVALFEIGSRFDTGNGETRTVAMAWSGSPMPLHWSGASREVDFFDIKGIVEQICGAFGAAPQFGPMTEPFLVAGQSANVEAGDSPIGIVGLVAPTLAEERGAPRHDKIFVAELSLDRLYAFRRDAPETARALPRHPFVVRDVSIVVSDTLPAENIRGTIQAAGQRSAAPLVAIDFFDHYKGKGISEDAVSLSVRLTFQAADRTLTDSDVQQAVDTIVRALAHEHGAVQR